MQLKNKFDFSILLAGILLAILLMATSCSKPGIEQHTCKWHSCPYKGITPDKWKVSVLNYIGNEYEGTDSYCIDMLHLEFTTDEYDELENKLFSNFK